MIRRRRENAKLWGTISITDTRVRILDTFIATGKDGKQIGYAHALSEKGELFQCKLDSLINCETELSNNEPLWGTYGRNALRVRILNTFVAPGVYTPCLGYAHFLTKDGDIIQCEIDDLCEVSFCETWEVEGGN